MPRIAEKLGFQMGTLFEVLLWLKYFQNEAGNLEFLRSI